jgi:uncharacterized protein
MSSHSSPDRGAARAPGPPSSDEVIRHLRTLLTPETDVAFSYLFGSVAKGRAHGRSDVDVAVWLDAAEQSPLGMADRGLELEGRLERALGRQVQVVVLNHAPADLVHNVLRHGLVIHSRDEPARVHFYVEHARRWYDMAAARALFDRAMQRRIREGGFGG